MSEITIFAKLKYSTQIKLLSVRFVCERWGVLIFYIKPLFSNLTKVSNDGVPDIYIQFKFIK